MKREIEPSKTCMIHIREMEPSKTWSFPVNRIRYVLISTASCLLLLCLFCFSIYEKYHAHTQRHAIVHALQRPDLSLHLQFHIKRPSMFLHGQSHVEAFVKPIQYTENGNAMVSYEGYASINDGNQTYEYKLVNDMTYTILKTQEGQESIRCIDAQHLPPLHDLLTAVHTANHIQSVNGREDINCPPGHLLKFQFATTDFVMCSQTRTGAPGFDIYGEDFDISVYYTKQQVRVTVPQLNEMERVQCNQVQRNIAILPTFLDLLHRTTMDWSNKILRRTSQQWWIFGKKKKESPSCTPRPCLFLHGIPLKEDRGLMDNHKKYWGDDITKHTPCCSSRTFAHMNTHDIGWMDESNQIEVCEFALKMSDRSDLKTRTIENTIIFAHSMGNLILASAIANQRCFMGKTSDWVAITAPMRGSMGSNYVTDECNKKKSFAKMLLSVLGECPANRGAQSIVYEPTASPYVQDQYKAAQQVYRNSVTRALCSNTFYGILSVRDQLVYLTAGKLIPHKSANDGVVEYQSCVADFPEEWFSTDYNTHFYRPHINHMDATVRNGDGWFDKAKQPGKWYEQLF